MGSVLSTMSTCTQVFSGTCPACNLYNPAAGAPGSSAAVRPGHLFFFTVQFYLS